MLSCFHPIPERYGQTDGRTDRWTDPQTDRIATSIHIGIGIFRPISRFNSKTVQDTATVTIYRMVKFPMSLSDL